MKKRWLLSILSAVILAGIILAIRGMDRFDSALQTGTVEDFAALDLRQRPVCLTKEGQSFGANRWTPYKNLSEREEENPLRQGVGYLMATGSLFFSELTVFATDPEAMQQAMHDDPYFGYIEANIAQCDYSLLELAAAEERLAAWLETAPKSVKDSVQFYAVMPLQNRVAVYIKELSLLDRLRMTWALGADCGKLFLVQGDLRKATEQMRFLPRIQWDASEEGQSLRYDGPPPENAREAGGRCEEILCCFNQIYSEEDPRSLTLQSILPKPFDIETDWRETLGYVEHSYTHFHGNRVIWYSEWTDVQENTLRAVLSSITPGEKWTVIHSCDW